MRRERPTLFKRRHFEAEIIVRCVRWYLLYPLSFRQLEELMSERNLNCRSRHNLAVGSTLSAGADRRSSPEIRDTNRSWRVDADGSRTMGQEGPFREFCTLRTTRPYFPARFVR
jgi:transposase, IS6 family